MEILLEHLQCGRTRESALDVATKGATKKDATFDKSRRGGQPQETNKRRQAQ